MKRNSVRQLTIAALLIAMGVVIPMVMPRIVIGPASFTLASHVPLFVAMFFSPKIAIAVALGTAFGFVMTAPFIIALRALSHIVFAYIGAKYLQKHPEIILSKGKFQLYNLWIGVIHSVVEMIVVALFFLWGNTAGTNYEGNFFVFLFGFMGIGGLIHSMIDYNIAYFVSNALSKVFEVPIFSKAREK
ncbi:hypothetical protein [Enterococcus olivae]